MARAKRSLSQNFLVDPNLQRKVVAELEARPEEAVLEVGAGHGELSRHLVGRVARLVLVEKDDALARELRERWGGRDDVRVVHADALEVDLGALLPPGPYRILSNVPYGITSPLLFAFLALRPPPGRTVLTVQKEVADRIVAEPGSGAYGALSVGVQARARAWPAFGIGRQAFRPVPEVDSAVVRLEPRPDRLGRLPEGGLRRLTREAFGRRRKQLQKILRSSPEYGLDRKAAEALCARLGLDPRTRPERLSPADFIRLAEALEEGRPRGADGGRVVGWEGAPGGGADGGAEEAGAGGAPAARPDC